VQGRYRVLDEAGQIVVTLNSKAKAEARAAELNEQHAADVAAALADGATPAEAVEAAELDRLREAALLAQVEADAAMEQAMDIECPQEDTIDLSDLQAEWDAHPEYAEAMTPAEDDVEASEGPALIARETRPQEIPVPAAEERQEEPAGDTGTSDTPAAPAEPEKPAKTVKPAKATKPKADQPAPHAFTTVGTTIKNHCAECGRTWAAAAHRKFREAQTETVEEVTAGTAEETEGEWTPAADDTTPDGKAPGETGADAS
jgi:hypothetical protein